jgi:probable HAF family extracellular repeat protein
MIDLGTLGGSFSVATAVNNRGEVVGYSAVPGDASYHAFVWTAASGMVDLGTLGGDLSVARGVNDNGRIVGYATTSGNVATRAAMWSPR